jgi:hypothetical protein
MIVYHKSRVLNNDETGNDDDNDDRDDIDDD